MKTPAEINVLIACEESQAVGIEFRKLGFNAYSNDIIDCSGGHPEWHIKNDIMEVIYDRFPKDWITFDVMIAFPPCTNLSVSGARWFKTKKQNGEQQNSIDFFMKIANAPIKYIAIENPIGIMSTQYRKPDQIIQPWQFGHGETKATCLWLKNLPKLEPTNIVEGREQKIWRLPPSKDRAKLRSKTYPGIAKAMAEQWGEYLLKD
jgi:site-specific DNA-cytosine methylase